MHKKKDIVILIEIACLISIAVHWLCTLGFIATSMIYHINNIIWFVLIAFCFIKKGRRIEINQKILFLVSAYIFGGIMSILTGGINGNVDLAGFFVLILWAMVVLAVLGIDFDYKFEINDIYKIHKIIIFISIVAAIYAMIVQKQYIANLFSTERGMLEQWLYRSFFITRNNYACMCLLGGMSSMLMWSSTQKGIYLFWQLLFLFQILCTNSRNAIVALLIFYAVIIWNKASKKGIVITLLFISLPIVVFNWKEIFEYVSTHFYHYDIVRSADSSQIRIIMWKDILKNIFLEGTFIFGYGSEYSSQYLLEQYGLESAHNVFFEILFSGGICKLGIYLFLLLRIRKKILDINDLNYRIVSIAMFWSIMSYSMFDAYVEMFSNCYYSLIVTLLLAFLPRYFDKRIATEKESL